MEKQLLERCEKLCGVTILQLANQLELCVPNQAINRKGFIGIAVEKFLGASAGNSPAPDFPDLGIELKTLPLDKYKKPLESTFITSIALTNIHNETWYTSQCLQKLKRVLWVTIEGDTNIPFLQRRIGKSFLWSPSVEEENTLKNDWELLTNFIINGELDKINANFGEYLQIRPKASNSKSLTYAFDGLGNRIQTLPRGFYLRSLFTKKAIVDRMFL